MKDEVVELTNNKLDILSYKIEKLNNFTQELSI